MRARMHDLHILKKSPILYRFAAQSTILRILWNSLPNIFGYGMCIPYQDLVYG